MPSFALFRALLLLAALDTAVVALLLLAAPADLLGYLHAASGADALLLLRALGVLALGHLACLAPAIARPVVYRSLVLVPLLGRALQVGMELWLLGAERVALSAPALRLLLAHDGIVLALLTGALMAVRSTCATSAAAPANGAGSS